METADWTDLLDDDFADEDTCLSREDCIEDLLANVSTSCLYCRLGELTDDGDGE